MGAKPIVDQDPWLVIRPGFRQRIKHVLYPVQANFGVGVSSFGTRVVPTRGLVGCPGTSMGGGWPDNQWVEESPVGRDTFDGCHQLSLDSSASIIPGILVTYQNLERTLDT